MLLTRHQTNRRRSLSILRRSGLLRRLDTSAGGEVTRPIDVRPSEVSLPLNEFDRLGVKEILVLLSVSNECCLRVCISSAIMSSDEKDIRRFTEAGGFDGVVPLSPLTRVPVLVPSLSPRPAAPSMSFPSAFVAIAYDQHLERRGLMNP